MRSLVIAAACLFICAASIPSSPAQSPADAPLPWQDSRAVIFDLDNDVSPGEAQIGLDALGRFAEISFTPKIKEWDSPHGWALWMKGYTWDDRPQIKINGKALELDPLARPDGLLFPIPAGMITADENTIRLDSDAPFKIKWLHFTLFPLLAPSEEIHFERVFSSPRLFAQPAKHPSQLNYDVEHIDLKIEISMASTFIIGDCTVTARALTNGLSQVALDYDPNGGNLAIQSVTNENATPLTFSANDANDWLIATLASPVDANDTFTLRVQYQGTPSTGGTFGAPYRRVTHAGTPQIYTFSEPYGARKWWPCKDLPDDKFLFDIHVTAPEPYIAVSNGALTQIETIGGGKRTFHFEHTYPITTYLVSISCTNFHYYEGLYTGLDEVTTMTVGHYIWPERADEYDGNEGTINSMEFFAQTFGEYPFIREKYVTATHSINSSMEHQTCTSLRPGGLSEAGLTRSNIHELAHSWFGNQVTCNTFDHLWLNEGFATWCEAWLEEHLNGRAAYLAYVSAWSISDYPALINPEADDFAGSIVYRKGGFVLHMLRRVMGDEKFFAAVRAYLVANAYQTVLTPDLQSECEAEYGESLDWFFQQWVYNGGRPTYRYGWHMLSQSEGATTNILQLTIEQTQAEDVFIMPLDVRVTGFGGEVLDFTVWNNQRTQTFDLLVGPVLPLSVALDPENWVLDNQELDAAPSATLRRVARGPGAGEATVTWASGGGATAGFEVIISEDLQNWSLAPGSDALTPASTELVIADAPATGPLFVIVRALADSASPSAVTDIYAAGPAQIGAGYYAGPVLIVDGYDRWEDQGRGPSHPFVAWHGRAINATGEKFDSCANEDVVSGAVALGDYKSVVWVLGEESTGFESFDATEQALATAYLQGGGRLFVTGAEIGWDLDNRNNGRAFYNTYLKADYVADDSQDYTVTGAAGSIFEGMAFAFDDGSAGIYYADWPDVITPLGGAIAALNYSPGNVAGIQFDGVFAGGTEPGRLVYFGFGFETIYPEDTSDEVMRRVMEFFGDPIIEPEDGPDGFLLN